MNVKKQQMQLQLQLQRRHNRTGFETLLLQDRAADETAAAPPSPGSPWSPADAGRYRHHRRHDHLLQGPNPEGSATPPDGAGRCSPSAEPAVTTPPPPSPLSLPSPYYDRNPIIGFPLHQHHHSTAKSPTTTAAAAATVPLANVQQNVVTYTSTTEQDLQGDHYANGSKHYYQRYQHNDGNCTSNGMTDGRDDDKENVKQLRDAECLQQQLDEVLRACVDYEERNKSRQQQQQSTMSTESAGNTSPGTPVPHQNRIKTNGSLPRDAKRPGSETSSPTSPLSPVSATVLSPTSPSSMMTWTTTSTSSSAMLSPLTPHSAGAADGDSVFMENDKFPSPTSGTAPQPQNVTGCGSPRSRIRTLVPSCPTPAAAAAEASSAADSYCGSNKDQLRQRLRHNGSINGNDVGRFKITPSNLMLPKTQAELSPITVSLQSASHKSPSPMQLQSTLLQTLSPSSWMRSSPFTVDSVDGGITMGSSTVSVAPNDRAEEAAEQRRKLLVELSGHKSRLVELHLRREEVDRELIIETALLRAELDVADDETRQSENIVDGLDRAVAECRQQMDVCTIKQQEQRTAADTQLAGHRRALHGLRSRLESVEDDNGAKTEIRASIDKQTELLEAEQKLYEDVEFGLLEEEAGWLARREELHRDRAAAVAVRRARRARAEWLRAQLDQLRSVGDDQLRALRTDINTATLSIQQGHKKLNELDNAATAANTAAAVPYADQYRRHQFQYEYSEQPRSLEWSWDQPLRSPKSPTSWSPTPAANHTGYSSPPITEINVNGLMTGSMTTTCCSSIGSSGAEDDGCRPTSDDSISRMSMSTIFDGGAVGIKMRPKNLSSPSDITKRPLTRYLPVRYDGEGMSENRITFDLRAHIESAGHQLEDSNSRGGSTDRHFWIDGTSCRGYLKKLSGAGGKNSQRNGRKWLKRWFVFDRKSRTLMYYHRKSDDDVATSVATEKKTRPRASIRFQDIQEVYVDHTNSSKGRGCAFVVKTTQRTFYLSAATGQAVRVWVDVIFTGAEGYREYLKVNDGGAIGGGQQTKS